MPALPSVNPRARFWVGLALLLLVTAGVYAPGLHGDFLFDDAANLSALGDMGAIDDAAALARYLTSGTADPTGRPLALLSFLLDARDWPADPYPFKRTNLLLHLLNVGLLAVVLRELMRGMRPAAVRPGEEDTVAVLGAALWGLHPFLVSTTLYVVQREAMLPATFTLLGIWGWSRARRDLEQAPERAAMRMAAFLIGCTAAATLCKANGVLLPVLIGALELTVLRATPTDPRAQAILRRTRLLLLALPSLALTATLLAMGVHAAMSDLSAWRPWTLTERTLTQPRVLLDYLSQLLLPRPYTSGLFNDDFPVSHSLTAPVTTLPALLGVAGLIALALWRRRHWPVLSAALLFYFGGQSIESTVIPLELYFEHRNYLPAMLLFWPLALGLQRIRRTDTQPAAVRRAAVAAMLLLPVALAVMTGLRAELWGKPLEQALVWGALSPHSPRAQAYAAQAEMAMQRPDLAISRLTGFAARTPPDLQIALTLIDAHCQLGSVPPAALEMARAAMRQTRDTGRLFVTWALDKIETRPCATIDASVIAELIRLGLENPRLQASPARIQDLHHLTGRLALAAGDAKAALSAFSSAMAVMPRPTLAARQAALLGQHGFPQLGLQHLDAWQDSVHVADTSWSMRRIHAWVLATQRYWEREFAILRETLLADLAATGDTPS